MIIYIVAHMILGVIQSGRQCPSADHRQNLHLFRAKDGDSLLELKMEESEL